MYKYSNRYILMVHEEKEVVVSHHYVTRVVSFQASFTIPHGISFSFPFQSLFFPFGGGTNKIVYRTFAFANRDWCQCRKADGCRETKNTTLGPPPPGFISESGTFDSKIHIVTDRRKGRQP